MWFHFQYVHFKTFFNGLKKAQIGHHLLFTSKDSKHCKIPTLAQKWEKTLGNVGIHSHTLPTWRGRGLRTRIKCHLLQMGMEPPPPLCGAANLLTC